jgi:hypothetical protein
VGQPLPSFRTCDMTFLSNTQQQSRSQFNKTVAIIIWQANCSLLVQGSCSKLIPRAQFGLKLLTWNHFSMQTRSYVWPDATITGSDISCSDMGQRSSSGGKGVVLGVCGAVEQSCSL